ncbi:hypothetical protein Sjap_018534 [Stephania japonica]|uniref:Cell division cycle protein 123 homolog n=1 Tax=Stephania japonica TaxID=461633 RepID=A0AAP0I867_9MAGN
MKKEEVTRCQIHEWYPIFKHVSIKTIIHELPESFVQYLLDDGPFVLPQSVYGEDALPRRINYPEEEDDYQVSEGSGDESEQPPEPPCFKDLELKIKDSIQILGGVVFPKLNWSAPKDSAWIATTGTIQCTSFSEITLLLRSSESLVHDLNHAFDSCVDKSSSRPPKFFLALKKWYSSLRPEMEFRCFVRHKLLVAISQREITSFYPTLLEKKDSLQMLIQDFFAENVREGFESNNYTFDVYVTRDGRVKLFDFNPWGAFTLPLMFSWEELENLEKGENTMAFKIVDKQCAVRPGLKTAVPYDYLDTGPGSGWDEVLRKAEEELRRQFQDSEASA